MSETTAIKYKKKPVVIEAIQFTGTITSRDEIISAFGFVGSSYQNNTGECHSITIKTLDGYMNARAGDWIIKGIKGELYPCKPDIFEATYERA